MATASGTTRTTTKRAPAKPPTHAGHTTSGAPGAGHTPTQKSMEAHVVTLAAGEVMDPNGLYEFLESLRALCTGVAFFAQAAGTQLEAAARKGAKGSTDGRLTMKQKLELAVVLRRMGRKMGREIPEDLLVAATAAVKTYSLMSEFLDNVESDSVSRPHRSSRGGFSLGG